MNVFNIDFSKLNLQLLPTFLRKPLLFAFLRAATAPIERIWHVFVRQQEDTFFLLKYNPSKRNVEIALRRRFGDEGIYIDNSGFHSEVETAYLDQYLPFYIDKPIVSHFIIYVPERTYNETNARAIYDFASFFVLPGFRYSVQQI